jgi:hypothetical protein
MVSLLGVTVRSSTRRGKARRFDLGRGYRRRAEGRPARARCPASSSQRGLSLARRARWYRGNKPAVPDRYAVIRRAAGNPKLYDAFLHYELDKANLRATGKMPNQKVLIARIAEQWGVEYEQLRAEVIRAATAGSAWVVSTQSQLPCQHGDRDPAPPFSSIVSNERSRQPPGISNETGRRSLPRGPLSRARRSLGQRTGENHSDILVPLSGLQ